LSSMIDPNRQLSLDDMSNINSSGKALNLTLHRPLALFANDIFSYFNELRQCALLSVRHTTTRLLVRCFEIAIDYLMGSGQLLGVLDAEAKTFSQSSAVDATNRLLSKTTRWQDNERRMMVEDDWNEPTDSDSVTEEFLSLSENFSSLLLPITEEQLTSIWGSTFDCPEIFQVKHLQSKFVWL